MGAYVIIWLFFAPGSFNWQSAATVATWIMTLFIQRAEHGTRNRRAAEGHERQRLIVETRAPRHCPTPSAAYRAEADLVFVISSSGCLLSKGHAVFGGIEPCRRSTR